MRADEFTQSYIAIAKTLAQVLGVDTGSIFITGYQEGGRRSSSELEELVTITASVRRSDMVHESPAAL
eukprot:2694349-Rhodomonas_salina.1